MQLIRSADDLPALATLPRLTAGDRVLVASPEFFECADPLRARQQWRALVRAYQALGYPVDVLPGEPLLPRYTFTAHHCLPVPPGLLADSPAAVISIMSSPRRQAELLPSAAALASAGLHLERLDLFAVRSFEGSGDASWHPTRALLFGGLGADPAAFERLSAWMGIPVAILDLVDSRFARLSHCLCPIDGRRALYFPDAFTADGRALIEASWPDAIPVIEAEALNLACNAHCPDGEHVLIQSGCSRTEAALKDADFEVIALDMEAIGGSLSDLKLQYWSQSRGPA